MSEKQIRAAQKNDLWGESPLNMHGGCQEKLELLRAQLSVATDALEWYATVWGEHVKPERIPNRAKEALEKIKGMANEKEKYET